MKKECLICGSPLEYLAKSEIMECALCHKKELSGARCLEGHFVCDDCHRKGLDEIIGLLLREKSKNPVEILEKLMARPFCHMHGPEHHVLVGASLLTACKNAGGELDLQSALQKMLERGGKVPGGTCGFWGACGAGLSAGIFVAIATDSSPLAGKPWGLANMMTGKALLKISETGGPRCCKRDSYLAVQTAIDFAREHLNVEMEKPEILCRHSSKNNQCLGKKCPFFRQGALKMA